jgi:transposase-like protein/IS1 family transposase
METKETKATSMNCPECSNASKRFGKHRNGLQRFRCLSCRKTFTEPHKAAFHVADYLNEKRGLQATRMLTEGCSIRTVERLTEIRRDTIIDLLVIAGQRCEKLMERMVRNVPATDVQADECWNFIYCKEKNKGPEDAHNDEIGDCYNWVAIDRPTKLVLAFVCGRRTGENAMALVRKLRNATSPAVRFQLTTDGLQAYIAAVDEMLLDRCDYAQLVKSYAEPQGDERRYSPAVCTGATKVVISGNPDEAKICTSHVERQNLTMRMQMRRLTRLTNAFSRKLENHRAAVALHFGWYNFCQIHNTLKVSPAMEAGITDHVWSVAELLA